MINLIKNFNFFVIPFTLLFGLFLINFKIISLDLDDLTIKYLSFGFFIFSLIWLSYNFISHNKLKFFAVFLGPYFLITFILQSGIITDKSKDLRIAFKDLLSKEKLEKVEIKTIRSQVNDELSYSKIIKILSQMPRLGNGIENLGDLQSNEYAWTTISEKYLEEYKNIQIKNNSDVFKPWILIFKN